MSREEKNKKTVSGAGGMGQASKDNYKSVIKTVRTVSGLSKSLAGASGNGHDKFGRSGCLRLPAD